jgi:cytochrome c oxidase subunit 1/cytochrome c oxidase subunit I+III
MPVSALFLMGAMAVLLLGMVQALLAPSLPVPATVESILTMARLDYLFWGIGIFTIGAVLNLHRESRPGNLTVQKAGFWMMFVGFNLAFFPTSPRRSHAFMPDPLSLFSSAPGPDIRLGIVLFALGVMIFIFTRARTRRSWT